MKTPTRIRIRQASRNDIPEIVECASTSTAVTDGAGFGLPPSERLFNDAERLSAAWIDPNRVGKEEVIVALADGRVVAYLTVEDREHSLELVNIDVRGDLQGRGIGTELVAHVEKEARMRGKEAVTLGTSRNASGTPWRSYPWWLRRGFRVTGEEENAWTRAIGPGTREIRMRKPT